MRIVPNTLALFWTRPGWRQTFHADLGVQPGETVAAAVARYRAMFPADTVRSVRDGSGRFVSFKES